jgi:hypothetical protein
MNHNALQRARHRQTANELKFIEENEGILLTEQAMKRTRFAHRHNLVPLYNSYRLADSSYAAEAAAAHPTPLRAQ